jgi:hypothetical protein
LLQADELIHDTLVSILEVCENQKKRKVSGEVPDQRRADGSRKFRDYPYRREALRLEQPLGSQIGTDLQE